MELLGLLCLFILWCTFLEGQRGGIAFYPGGACLEKRRRKLPFEEVVGAFPFPDSPGGG